MHVELHTLQIQYFYYYAHKVKKTLDIELEIWGINHLENTNFKTGFCGVKPEYYKKWNNFASEISGQLQIPIEIRKNALSIIIRLKSNFKELFTTRLPPIAR